MIHPDEPYCSVYDSTTGKFVTRKLKGSEPAVVDYVAVDGKNKSDLQKVYISLYCNCLCL